MSGPQEWLSFYFKSPQVPEGERPTHDLFEQRRMLTDVLGELAMRRPALTDKSEESLREPAV
jgi:myo-inositol-1-phosphate synthase